MSRVDADRVRAQVDLVELIQRETKLRRAGATWRGRCPIHGGDRDSLRVRGVKWECFACGEGGDCIEWIMKIQGLSFRDAVDQLVPGLSDPGRDPAEEPATWDAVEARLQRERPQYLRRVESAAEAELEWAAEEGRPISWREAEDRAERRLQRRVEPAAKRQRLADLLFCRLLMRFASILL